MTEYKDPVEVDTTPRRAELEVKFANSAQVVEGRTIQAYFLKLTASNGETLGTGETQPFDSALESREAWLRAFVEVLEDDGWVVMKPHPDSSGEQLLKAIFSEPEASGLVVGDLDHNDRTLQKVYDAMLDNGVDIAVAKASVSAMQNAGILFRERRA